MTASTASISPSFVPNGLVLAALFALILAPIPVMAQGSEAAAADGIHLGPLGVSPALEWHSRYDDNVFRTGDRRTADVISTLGFKTELAGQARWLEVSASGTADWVHFDRLASERGANVGAGLKLSLLLDRLAPYVGISYGNSRQRSNPEIDTRPRMAGSTVTAGGLVHLGGKTILDLAAARTSIAYDTSATAEGENLSRALNRGSDRVSVSLEEIITPVTRLTLEAEMDRERFESSAIRNADHIRLTTGFESSGLIDGAARVGLRILRPHDASLPESRGLFVSAATSVTALDRFRIGLDARRDVEPSYRQTAYYEYIDYGLSLSYAMNRQLRFAARVDRRHANYRAIAGVVAAPGDPVEEEEMRYGSSVGYQLGASTGLEIGGTYSRRTSSTASRQFDGLNVSAGVTYAF